MSANDAFSVEVAQGAADYATAHGMKVVYNNKYPADTTDVSSVVSAIKATNPDLILNGGHLQDALLLQKGFKEQNVNAKVFGYSVGPDTPDFRKTLGKDANYVFGGTQWSPTAKYKGAPGFITDSQSLRRGIREEVRPRAGLSQRRVDARRAWRSSTRSRKPVRSIRKKCATRSRTLDVVTFYGILKFDDRGINMYKPMAVEPDPKG